MIELLKQDLIFLTVLNIRKKVLPNLCQEDATFSLKNSHLCIFLQISSGGNHFDSLFVSEDNPS